MKKISGALGALLLMSVPAAGQGSSQIASQLGNVLASEEPCGLTYDQAAIEAFIDKNVKPSDLDFASELSMMTTGKAYMIKKMTPSALTAHCTQIKRTAKTYKFIP